MNTYEIILDKIYIEAEDENDAYEQAKRLINSPDVHCRLSITSVDPR